MSTVGLGFGAGEELLVCFIFKLWNLVFKQNHTQKSSNKTSVLSEPFCLSFVSVMSTVGYFYMTILTSSVPHCLLEVRDLSPFLIILSPAQYLGYSRCLWYVFWLIKWIDNRINERGILCGLLIWGLSE